MTIEYIKRNWANLAPKLIAFLATGLTASGLLYVLSAFSVTIAPELAVILVGAVSSLAAYIQRDNLLALAPGQFSLKVLAFILTSATAAGLIALAGQIGIDLTPYSALIGVILTAAAGVVGYFQSDAVVVDAGSGKVGSRVTIAN